MITFRVEGKPIGKQRPRFANGHAYTPARTKAWESQVGWAARAAMGGSEPFTGAVSVKLGFWRKDKRRVDIDNLAKAILDGIQGICFANDSQVVALNVLLTRSASWEGCDVEVQRE